MGTLSDLIDLEAGSDQGMTLERLVQPTIDRLFEVFNEYTIGFADRPQAISCRIPAGLVEFAGHPAAVQRQVKVWAGAALPALQEAIDREEPATRIDGAILIDLSDDVGRPYPVGLVLRGDPTAPPWEVVRFEPGKPQRTYGEDILAAIPRAELAASAAAKQASLAPLIGFEDTTLPVASRLHTKLQLFCDTPSEEALLEHEENGKVEKLRWGTSSERRKDLLALGFEQVDRFRPDAKVTGTALRVRATPCRERNNPDQQVLWKSRIYRPAQCFAAYRWGVIPDKIYRHSWDIDGYVLQFESDLEYASRLFYERPELIPELIDELTDNLPSAREVAEKVHNRLFNEEAVLGRCSRREVRRVRAAERLAREERRPSQHIKEDEYFEPPLSSVAEPQLYYCGHALGNLWPVRLVRRLNRLTPEQLSKIPETEDIPGIEHAVIVQLQSATPWRPTHLETVPDELPAELYLDGAKEEYLVVQDDELYTMNEQGTMAPAKMHRYIEYRHTPYLRG